MKSCFWFGLKHFGPVPIWTHPKQFGHMKEQSLSFQPLIKQKIWNFFLQIENCQLQLQKCYEPIVAFPSNFVMDDFLHDIESRTKLLDGNQLAPC